jgi:hypothetical protein
MNLHPTRPRPNTAILKEINAIPYAVPGTLTTKRYTKNDGSISVYHQLQQTVDGKNVTQYVPRDKFERVRQGVENFQRREKLLDELDKAGLHAALNPETVDEGKKKRPEPNSKPNSKSCASPRDAVTRSPKPPSPRSRP